MELAGCDERLDTSARLVGRVQLKERVGPEGAARHLFLDLVAERLMADIDEALRVRAVLADEIVA